MRYTNLFYNIVDEESNSAKSAESTESNVLPLHCPNNKTLVAIRYVQRTMHKLNYALYRGHIYKKPSESKFAYVYTTTIESFLNTLLANKKIAEVPINQLQQVDVMQSNRECSIIKQIQIDHNLIEVLQTGTCLNIEEKRFVCDPFGESDIGKITPRAFVHYTYKEGVIPHRKRFTDAIENSFGRGTDECKDFLRKYYQLLLHGKFPQKTKKLCLIGHSDNGKTSWFQPFQAIIPLPFIAAVTREGQFSAHKLSPDFEICYMNEWSGSLGSEDAEKILEGGLQSMPQNHKSAQVFAYKSGFFIVSNKMPYFGEGPNSIAIMNIIRTFITVSLPKKSSKVSSLFRRDCMKILHYVAFCLQEEPLLSDDEGDDNRVTDDNENLGAVYNDFDAKQSLINVNEITDLEFADSQCTSSTIDYLEDPLDFRAIPQEILYDGFLKQDEVDSSRWVVDSPLDAYKDGYSISLISSFLISAGSE